MKLKNGIKSFIALLILTNSSFADEAILNQDYYLVKNLPEWAAPYLPQPSYDHPQKKSSVLNWDIIMRLTDTAEKFHQKIIYVGENYDSIKENLHIFHMDDFLKLNLHQLSIIRNGQEQTLTPNDYQLDKVEYEENERNFDESYIIILNMSQLQTGDTLILKYSYSGINPNLNPGNMVVKAYLTERKNINKANITLISNSQYPITSQVLDNPRYKKAQYTHNNALITSYQFKDISLQKNETLTPEWYSPTTKVYFSQFKSWQHVAKWGKEIFSQKNKSNRILDRKIHQIQQEASPEKQILEALKLVQREIHYFSVPIGASTHKPRHPGKVYAQKFGDCKDKSNLLTYILRKLKFDAVSVLVHSSMGEQLNNKIPSPWAFDHVIVKLDYNNNSYFLDGTKDEQSLPLEQSNSEAIGWYLPLTDDGTLTKKNVKKNSSFFEKYTSITSTAIDSPVEFTTSEIFNKSPLNSLYSTIGDSTNISEPQKKKIMSKLQEKSQQFSLLKNIEFNYDKEKTNIIFSYSGKRYDFWIKGYAWLYRNILSPGIIEELNNFRTSPLATPQGEHHYIFELNSHQPLLFSTDNININLPYFWYKVKTEQGGNSIKIAVSYWFKNNHLSLDEIKQLIPYKNQLKRNNSLMLNTTINVDHKKYSSKKLAKIIKRIE